MRLLVWFVAMAALILGIWMIWGGGWAEDFTLQGNVVWLNAAGPWAWAAGFLLLVGDLILPVPGTVVISALGYIYGFFLGGVISSGGLVAAGLLGYGAGRVLGKRFARRWLGAKDYEIGRQLFARRGGWIVAMSRALPILPEVISCTAGLVRMPFQRFLIALICGSVPMGFVFAGIGQAGQDSPGWAVGLNFVVPALLWWLAGHVKRKNGSFPALSHTEDAATSRREN